MAKPKLLTASVSSDSAEVALSVEKLTVAFQDGKELRTVVEEVSLTVRYGEVFGLVGESGSGKSITALSILGIQPKPQCHILQGRIIFRGQDLLDLSERELRDIRGKEISMIFQEPMSALNPTFTVGSQLVETIRTHQKVRARKAEDMAVQLLEKVGVTMARIRLQQYPHELSGGLCQRVMIAMALSCSPTFVIADEPTTALDVTIQAQILHLLVERQREAGLSLLLITHDIGVIAEIADRVAVMYLGRIVEESPVRDIIENPLHPYTKALIDSIPRMDKRVNRLPMLREDDPRSTTEHGCAFAPRCKYADTTCEQQDVALMEATETRKVRCLKWAQISHRKLELMSRPDTEV